MKKHLVGLLVFSFLYFAAFARNTEGVSHKREQPPTAGEDRFEKLKIQKYSVKVPAPDLTLADLNGKPVTLKDLKGKVVFLNFWATWCPPCILEMPTMEKLHQGFGGKGLVILAVNFRESPKQVRAFLKEHKLTFKILLDPKGAVSRLYTTWSLPVTFIVNKRGERVGMAIGHREWDTPDAKEYFRRLLDEKQ